MREKTESPLKSTTALHIGNFQSKTGLLNTFKNITSSLYYMHSYKDRHPLFVLTNQKGIYLSPRIVDLQLGLQDFKLFAFDFAYNCFEYNLLKVQRLDWLG